MPDPTADHDAGLFDGARHADVRDRDGRRIGVLEQVFLDPDSGAPLWVEVAGGLFGMARNIAPAGGARRTGDAIVLDVTAESVDHAPALDPGDGITAAEDSELRAHYGLRAENGHDTGRTGR